MLFTLAAVIFLFAILVFFSQEFIRTFKRIFAIKGAIVILPLAFASWAVFNLDYLFVLVIYYVRECLHKVLTLLIKIIPFQQGAQSIALIVLLTFISVAPVFLMDWINRRRTYKPYKYPYVTSAIIWITGVMLLLII